MSNILFLFLNYRKILDPSVTHWDDRGTGMTEESARITEKSHLFSLDE